MDQGFRTDHEDDAVRIHTRPTVVIMDISDEEAILWDKLAGLDQDNAK